MTIHEFAIIIAIALTAGGYSLAYEVFRYWGKTVMIGMKKKNRKGGSWLMLASTLGILFMALDSGYWAIPWALHLFESDHASEWFEAGIYFNIPFRQLALIVFCLLHLRGYFDHVKNCDVGKARFLYILKRSYFVFAVVWLLLFLSKSI